MSEKLNCIMMIDDDAPTNFISNMILEEVDCTNHYQIIDSAVKALAYLENIAPQGHNIPPDLIFLDINMPRMNGWEFLEEYKKLVSSSTKKPVIIMLTTSLNPDDRIRAKSIAEVDGFECKPLTTEMMQRVIETYFTALQQTNKIL